MTPFGLIRSLFIAAAVAASMPAVAHASTSRQAISRVVFADDRLWLLHDDGVLVSLRPDDARPARVDVGGKAIEICKSDGHLLAVVATGTGDWAIRRRTSAGWDTIATVTAGDDKPIALGCAADRAAAVLVTERRLFEVSGGQVRAVTLTEEVTPSFGIGTALFDRGAIWVGLNAGEWGGGLRRISLADGKVETIEHNRSGALCGGPLNSACDPVNGIVAAPSHPGCVVAAIGLVHMMSHGRIVEACDTGVRRLYFKQRDPQPPFGEMDDGEPSATVSFFGLARSGDTMWAVGIDGLYRFDGASPPQIAPLPKFKDRGGYRVSFDVPGIVLVLTAVNQRRSMSGSVPIMAVR